MTRLRLGADGHLGDEQAALGDRFIERAIFRGINIVDAAREYGRRAGRKPALMRRRIDAARKPRDNEDTVPSQL